MKKAGEQDVVEEGKNGGTPFQISAVFFDATGQLQVSETIISLLSFCSIIHVAIILSQQSFVLIRPASCSIICRHRRV